MASGKPNNTHPSGKKRPYESKNQSDDGKRNKSRPDYNADKIPSEIGKFSRKEKKELLLEKKARKNKNFPIIQETVSLWEQLRRRDVPADKRAELVTSILKLSKGRIADLTGSHTASRVVQSCLKYGNKQNRATILSEVEPKMVELSKSPYGRFVPEASDCHILRYLTDVNDLTLSKRRKENSLRPVYNYAKQDVKPAHQMSMVMQGLLKAYRGRLGELLRHPAAAHVVDDLYTVADTRQRNAMAAEFYSREYALFTDGTLNSISGPPACLGHLMDAVDGAKKRSIIQLLAGQLSPIFEKGLMDAQLTHRLTAEYLTHSPTSLVADAVESLSGEPLLHMIHTKDGVTAACMVVAYSTAKERKKILKAFKGHVRAAAKDEWGTLALITALSVVDDTSLSKKSIVNELQGDVEELIKDKHSHRIVLQLLHPYSPRYLAPHLLSIVKPEPKVIEGDGSLLEKATGQKYNGEQEVIEESDDEKKAPVSGPLGSSKKEPDVRRREILGSGNGSFASSLVTACASQLEELLKSQWGCDTLFEMCRGGEDGVLMLEDIAMLHDAVVGTVVENPEVLDNFHGSRMLKRIILTSKESEAASAFVMKLWKDAIKGKCKSLMESHAAKVVAALVSSGNAAVKTELTKEVPNIAKWASKFTTK